ncbi:MAG: ribonuclease P protein component [Saprospiraceae bacterium]|nr:ribonuclease P protein component [Saprospiraceae bacterium]
MIAILCNHLFFTIHCNMFTFQKGEKLKSRKTIGKLFTEGKSFISYPIRFVWVKMESPLSEFPIQMALTVPKRSFPKAVNRNRLRRRIRESYRLNKHSIYTKLSSSSGQYGIMLIYIARETLDFHQIEEGIKKGLRKLPHRL